MKITPIDYRVRGVGYVIRSAEMEDAENLSSIRVKIDGETEYLDREKGEAFIDAFSFKKIIKEDTKAPTNLFLVAEVNGRIIGYARCEGNQLKRFSHKITFGVGVLNDYWGYGIGKNLLKESIIWADRNNVKKIMLSVTGTNTKAIKLYHNHGFEVEGILKKDKQLSEGHYENTVVMGRFQGE
ncbi:MAG: GNAT family N-acetyltransferase [Anaerobacillus sp.]